MLDVGDFVGFKNEKQEGTVTKIISNGFFEVAVQEGLDIKVHESELFLLRKAGKEILDSALPGTEDKLKEKIKPEEGKFFPINDNLVCHVAMPAEENKILSGAVSFYIINSTSFELLLNLAGNSVDNKLQPVFNGLIKANSESYLHTLSREQLADWNHFTVQIIFYKNDPFDFKYPFVKEVPLMLPDIDERVKSSDFRIAFSKTQVLADFNEPNEIQLKDLIARNNISTQHASKIDSAKYKISVDDFKRYGIIDNIPEVDLHIESLKSDFKNLSNSEILSIQLEKFHGELNAAIQKHCYSITFIHGVGDGVLKKAIRSELRSYPEVNYKDGDSKKYGAGATTVLLR